MRSKRDFAIGLASGALIAAMVLGGRVAATPGADDPAPGDSEELARLYDEDQADRQPESGKPIDWAVVGPRDRAREARVKELYEAGGLRTGKDYRRAAMVFQHAQKPEDYLLAHEFCVVALSKGDREARWLAAATEDRFLMNLGRPQRFGTQFRSSGPDQPVKLYEVGPGVTDALRRELNVPTLDEARKREAMMEALSRGKPPAPAKP
jgi:hypothetical protein